MPSKVWPDCSSAPPWPEPDHTLGSMAFRWVAAEPELKTLAARCFLGSTAGLVAPLGGITTAAMASSVARGFRVPPVSKAGPPRGSAGFAGGFCPPEP